MFSLIQAKEDQLTLCYNNKLEGNSYANVSGPEEGEEEGSASSMGFFILEEKREITRSVP